MGLTMVIDVTASCG